jgi:hypothetical protein
MVLPEKRAWKLVKFALEPRAAVVNVAIGTGCRAISHKTSNALFTQTTCSGFRRFACQRARSGAVRQAARRRERWPASRRRSLSLSHRATDRARPQARQAWPEAAWTAVDGRVRGNERSIKCSVIPVQIVTDRSSRNRPAPPEARAVRVCRCRKSTWRSALPVFEIAMMIVLAPASYRIQNLQRITNVKLPDIISDNILLG